MDGAGNQNTNNPPPAEGRRPFTSLSQEEADLALALARLLQQQERAYMMLTGRGGGGYDYDDDDGDEEEEDASDYEEEGGGAEVGLDLDPALMALAGFGRAMEQDDDVLEGE